MKKSLSILIFLLIVFQSSAKDHFFNRLEKLYEKDAKTCLIVAKRHIKFFPKQAASYFFCSKISKDKYKKGNSLHSQYNHLNKAIDFANRFEELSDESLKKRANWSEFKIGLINETQELVDLLQLRNEFSYSERLDDKLNKFNRSYKQVAIVTEKNEIKEVFNLSNSITLFYGMPTGKEVVESASLTEEQKLLNLINAERKRLGMQPLAWEEGLANASRYHSYDLATQNYFNHSSYDRINGNLVKIGGTFDRIIRFYTKSYVNGENIAAGHQSAYKTYQQWLKEKTHYKVMFNPKSKKVGIGVVYFEKSPFGYYWTMCTAL